MNLLKMFSPIGWEVLFTRDNEQLLRMYSGDRVIYGKIRIVPYKGIREVLQDEFRKRIDAIATVVDESYSTFVLNHLRWYVDSYVISDKAEKYRSYYYTLLDENCVALELVTGNAQSALAFVSEAKRLINSIDYSSLNRTNRFMVNNNFYIVDTPTNYKFSDVSTDEHIVFVGENGYAVANIAMPDISLTEFVNDCIEVGTVSVKDCEIFIAEAGIGSECEWIVYKTQFCGNVTSTCAYVKQSFGSDVIVSFFYEYGEVMKLFNKFFKFRKEVS